MISFLIEAMHRQTSTKAVPLSAIRLLELGEILRDACSRQEELDIPDTLIHNDLNTGNILWDGERIAFSQIGAKRRLGIRSYPASGCANSIGRMPRAFAMRTESAGRIS